MSADLESPAEVEARLAAGTPRPQGGFRRRLRALIIAGSTDLVGPRPARLRILIAVALAVGTIVFAAAVVAIR